MAPALSDEQRRAIESGGGAPVVVVDPQSKCEYVLIRAESYVRIRELLGDDDSFEIRETYAAQGHAAETAWDHPADADYDDYDAHRMNQ